MNLENIFVPIYFNEQEAMIFEVAPGMHFVDCADDNRLKTMFLEQNLGKEDYIALESGELNMDCAEIMQAVGLGIEDIRIKHCWENRNYHIEIIEQFAVDMPVLELRIPVSGLGT